jgi:hypothetical protein
LTLGFHKFLNRFLHGDEHTVSISGLEVRPDHVGDFTKIEKDTLSDFTGNPKVHVFPQSTHTGIIPIYELGLESFVMFTRKFLDFFIKVSEDGIIVAGHGMVSLG